MRRTGRRWIVLALILKLWDVSWSMWDHRNHVLHQGSDHLVLENDELSRDIREEYRLGTQGVPSELRYIFEESLDTVLSYSVWRKRIWLTDAAAARALGLRTRRQSRPADQPAITNWIC